jgi:hypothetical protein
MKQETGRRRYARGLQMALAVSGLAAGLAFSASSAWAAAQSEVELAFDMTGSMAASVDQARQRSHEIITEVRKADPEARFAVVQFRDKGNPAGEYELLQPMTGDLAAIEAALGRLEPSSNPSPGNVFAESYTLAFQRARTDASIGWTSATRKELVVFGDAQPHGAGRAGLAGCTDQSNDPDGLDLPTELQALGASGRSLFMVLVPSALATATLECYQSIADRVSSALPDAGGQGSVPGPVSIPDTGTIDDHVSQPVTERLLGLSIRIGAVRRRTGGNTVLTVSIRNNRSTAVNLFRISASLPKRLTYVRGSSRGTTRHNPARAGRQLTWTAQRAIGAHKRVTLRFKAAGQLRLRRSRFVAAARFESPTGPLVRSPQARLTVL